MIKKNWNARKFINSYALKWYEPRNLVATLLKTASKFLLSKSRFLVLGSIFRYSTQVKANLL